MNAADFVAHVAVRLACEQKILSDELVIVVNDTIVSDERMSQPGPSPTPIPHDRTYREDEMLYLYPWDRWNNQIHNAEVKIYSGACKFRGDDRALREGMFLVGTAVVNTRYWTNGYGSCGHFAESKSLIAPPSLECGSPVCEELP